MTQSHPQSNSQPKFSSSRARGKWVTGVLVAMGLLACVISVSYWRWYNQQMTQAQQYADAGSVNWDLDAAKKELEQLSERVNQALEAGRVNMIQGDALQFVQRYPKFAPAYTLMGQVYLGLGDQRKAYDAFETSLKINQVQHEVHLLAGTICMQTGDLDKAQYHYRTAVSLQPSQIKYRLHLAQNLIDRQQYNQARHQLLIAMRQSSTSHTAYALLSDLYLKQNKLALALNQISKAIENTPIMQRPLQVTYLRTQSQILRRQGKAGQALQVLQNLSFEERGDMLVVEDMATCWTMQSQFQQAAQVYKQASVDYPQHPHLAALKRGEIISWLKAKQLNRAQLALDQLRLLDAHAPAIEDLQNQIDRARASSP